MFDSEYGGIDEDNYETDWLRAEVERLNLKIQALEQEIVELKKQIPQKKIKLKKT